MQPEPTPRATFTGFMAASLLVLEVLGIGHPFTGLAGGFLVTLLVVAYVEALRSQHRLPWVRVRRISPERAVEGVPVEVVLEVENRGERIPVLIVEDIVPSRLRPEGRTWFRTSLGPGERRTLSWTAVPAPGYHRIDEVVLSVMDPLGLFESWTTRLVKSSISVAPLSLGEAEKGRGRPGRAEASWSRLTGHGLEFHHIRDYEPGDDVRMIVWTATARTGRPMVRVGIMDVEASLYVFFDLSGPSWVGTPGETAADWIMRLGLSLASMVAASGGVMTGVVYQGEIWWNTGHLRGRDAVDVLRRSFSLQGPSRATLRMRIGAIISRNLDTAPPGSTHVYLLGPGAPLSRILEELAGTPGAIVVVVAPTGDSPVEELVRRVERRVAGEASRAYMEAGLRLIYVDTVEGVYRAYREIAGQVARARLGAR